MRILGIDPGYARLGWGLIDGETYIACGVIETKKSLPEEKRLGLLFDQLKQLIGQYKPEVVAVEKLFFFKNQITVIPVAQSRGLALLAAAQADLPVFSYTPPQIKMAVSGYGRADKSQVQSMVKAILKLKALPQPDDAADALAVALTHSFSRKLYTKL
ncbi:MAG TPA: crossover junction endodeoxyribonuclease RuvC [Patescibacteria group bacterium]|nr:crossover junction endodeoxyribonuclease RuvC [Patescibacteria group bacterium]